MPISNAKWHLIGVKGVWGTWTEEGSDSHSTDGKSVQLVQTINMVPNRVLHSSASALHRRQQEQAYVALFHLLKVQFCGRAELVEV